LQSKPTYKAKTMRNSITKFTILILILLICAISAGGKTMSISHSLAMQDSTRAGTFRIAELNCENLFDTIHDEGFNDHEFLPSAERHWDSGRYWKKITMIAREIASLHDSEPIDIVALIEVENDSVLRDLTERSILRRIGYRYLMTHSNDPRGVDVGLLYLEGGFKPLKTESIRLGERISPTLRTRDVLHVEGRTRSGDTLDVFVCHLPSKVGGRKAQKNRNKIAEQLKLCIDSVCARNPRANIVIIGDFNDSPYSKTITTSLAATPIRGKTQAKARKHNNGSYATVNQPLEPSENRLYNISTPPTSNPKVKGTYSYRGDWEILDQCIINTRLANKKSPLHISDKPYTIISPKFLLETDATYGGYKPRRTFQGPLYKGGFSDHLPILIELDF